MHLCMCECMYVRVYANRNVSTCLCMNICMCLCVHACMYACMRVCVYACTYVCTYVAGDVWAFLLVYLQQLHLSHVVGLGLARLTLLIAAGSTKHNKSSLIA